MHVHVVARAHRGQLPLADDERCRWLWRRLQACFPDALAGTLMPNHLHLILVAREGIVRTLSCLLGAFARVFALGPTWLPVPEPQELLSPDKLQRGVRYVLLNPCRPWHFDGEADAIVADPLLWPWSTLRDTIGAIARPWTPADRLSAALGWHPDGFARRFHRYVSSDPHVAVSGTPLPQRAAATDLPSCSYEQVVGAVAAACRTHPAAIRVDHAARKLFAGLARRQGLRSAKAIAALCGVHRNSVPRLASACPPEWTDAGALCLGDERLRTVGLEMVHSLTIRLGRAVVAAPRFADAPNSPSRIRRA